MRKNETAVKPANEELPIEQMSSQQLMEKKLSRKTQRILCLVFFFISLVGALLPAIWEFSKDLGFLFILILFCSVIEFSHIPDDEDLKKALKKLNIDPGSNFKQTIENDDRSDPKKDPFRFFVNPS